LFNFFKHIFYNNYNTIFDVARQMLMAVGNTSIGFASEVVVAVAVDMAYSADTMNTQFVLEVVPGVEVYYPVYISNDKHS
jgi:hypothetical protein